MNWSNLFETTPEETRASIIENFERAISDAKREQPYRPAPPVPVPLWLYEELKRLEQEIKDAEDTEDSPSTPEP